MTAGRHGGRPRRRQPPPRWFDALVTIILLVYLGYAMVVLKEQGLPFATIVGGLLAGYLGVNHLKRNDDGDDPPAAGGK